MNNNKFEILSGSMLKVFALLAMTLDHISKYILDKIPECREVVFTVLGHNYSWCKLLTSIGRSAFPLFVFLLIEGYCHTHNRKKYGINLLLFAAISEIPWNLLYNNTILFFPKQNVFFTLFLGYLGICAWEQLKDCRWKQWTSVILLLIVSFYLHADYSFVGYITILIMYFLRSSHFMQGLGTLCLNSSHLRCLPASICMILYNGKRGFIKGKFLKYLFYAYYPVHLLVLWIIIR